MGRLAILNEFLVLVGAVSLHAIDSMNHKPAQVLGLPYDLVWMHCIGLFAMVLNGLSGLMIHRYRRRDFEDFGRPAHAGIYLHLPTKARWELAGASLGAMAVAAWLAQQSFGWLVQVVDAIWLPKVVPGYDMALFNVLYGSALVYTIEYFRDRAALSEAREHMAQRLSDQAQLNLLRSQLDPHMLFNTLSNLYELIDDSPEQARALLTHLIGFLRSTLTGSRATQHALAEEFKLAAAYLALMQIRMGDRLKVSLSLPSMLDGAIVPAMLLQPLVENAIKHGLEPRIDGGELMVSACIEQDDLVLRVSNSGVGLEGDEAASALKPEPASGFGLHYVRDRLRALYGAGASIDFQRLASQDLTQVTLRMPLNTRPEALLA